VENVIDIAQNKPVFQPIEVQLPEVETRQVVQEVEAYREVPSEKVRKLMGLTIIDELHRCSIPSRKNC